MKNLVIAVCGDESLHPVWVKGVTEFDLFVAYYGDAGRYRGDGRFYATKKGTKLRIVHDLFLERREVFEEYDAVFVPDDDLFLQSRDINKLFALFHEFRLDLAQPSIFGWMSWPITATVPTSRLRYTNWVEIMSPVFSRSAFAACLPTFTETRSNWGVEFLWSGRLGDPQDRIAIIDEVVAVHTRPCFFGDTYINNNNTFDSARSESAELLRKYKLEASPRVYHTVHRDPGEYDRLPSEQKFLPTSELFKELVPELRKMILPAR